MSRTHDAAFLHGKEKSLTYKKESRAARIVRRSRGSLNGPSPSNNSAAFRASSASWSCPIANTTKVAAGELMLEIASKFTVIFVFCHWIVVLSEMVETAALPRTTNMDVSKLASP